jgi:hypothetical protein
MKDSHFLAIMGVIGLLIGLGGYQLAQQPSGSDEQAQYCSRVGESLQVNGSFNGTVNCYPPGVLNVKANLSDNVENQTDLQCVCRNTYKGNENIFSIRKSR